MKMPQTQLLVAAWWEKAIGAEGWPDSCESNRQVGGGGYLGKNLL